MVSMSLTTLFCFEFHIINMVNVKIIYFSFMYIHAIYYHTCHILNEKKGVMDNTDYVFVVYLSSLIILLIIATILRPDGISDTINL